VYVCVPCDPSMRAHHPALLLSDFTFLSTQGNKQSYIVNRPWLCVAAYGRRVVALCSALYANLLRVVSSIGYGVELSAGPRGV